MLADNDPQFVRKFLKTLCKFLQTALNLHMLPPDEKVGQKVAENAYCETAPSWGLNTSMNRICSCSHLPTSTALKIIGLSEQHFSNWFYQDICLADQNVIAN